MADDEDRTVIDFFSRQPIRPHVADDSPELENWYETYLQPVLEFIATAADTFDEEEFRDSILEVKRQVADWPDP